MNKQYENIAVFVVITMLGFSGCDQPTGGVTGERSFDAGACFASTTPQLVHVFDVENTSHLPMNIVSIKKSCTCTSAEVDKIAIDPGGSARLTMRVDVRDILNQWSIYCTLLTDLPDEPERIFELKYRSYPNIRFSEECIEIGSITPGRADNPSVEDHSSGWVEVYEPIDAEPDSLDTIEVESPISLHFDKTPIVDLIENGSVRRHRYRFSAGVDTDAEHGAAPGVHTKSILARTEGGRVASAVLVWTINSPVDVTPENVSFGLVDESAGTSKRRVVVRARDNHPFRLLEINGGRENLEVRVKKGDQPDSMHIFELVLSKDESPQRFIAGEVTLGTDREDVPTIRIPWSAIKK